MATTVMFGDNAATSVTYVSATEVTATAPAHITAEAVDVTVTTSAGEATLADAYTYTSA